MTVLVSETWAGTGNVNGKVPTTGGGTWAVYSSAGNTMSYGNLGGYQGVSCSASFFGDAACLHSTQVQNARIKLANCLPAYSVSAVFQQTPVTIWARSDTARSNAYKVQFTDGNGTSLFQGIRVYKRVSGADTQLAEYAGVGVGSTIEVQLAGSSLRVLVSGSVVIDITDSTFSGAGYWGGEVNYFDDPDYGHDSHFGPITLETPYLDISSVLAGKAVTNGLVSTVGVGYLGAADIALISQSILATLQANTIPVDVQLMNSAEVIGTGTTGDAWRGVGVLP